MQRQFQPLVTSSSEAAAHPDSAAASPAGKPSAAPTDPTNPTAAEEADALHASSLSTATAAAVERGEGDDITARDLVVRLCRATGARRVSELLARLLTQQVGRVWGWCGIGWILGAVGGWVGCVERGWGGVGEGVWDGGWGWCGGDGIGVVCPSLMS